MLLSMSGIAWHWLTFGCALMLLLSIDLITHRNARHSSPRAAAWWSAIWIAAGLAFSLVVLLADGLSVHEYLAAYAMEKSLSLDNMFVFLLIFTSLNIPDKHQHTALAWGIFGALAFRAVFIALGLSALQHWAWVRYLFGAILLLAAYHALHDDPTEARQSRVVRWLSRHLPVSKNAQTNDFLVAERGKRRATPLLVALVAIEVSDIAFAVDSVPAALSVSQNEFIVYSSNAFAILGLRSLYLATHGLLTRFGYLHYGLAFVLAFAGVKIVAGEMLNIPPLASVLIILAAIGVSAAWSLRSPAANPSR